MSFASDLPPPCPPPAARADVDDADFGFSDDDVDARSFGVDAVDDFLTDAAPLGRGIEDAMLFACAGPPAPFFTSDPRLAEASGTEAAATVLYQKLRNAERVALDDGDEIWRATLDGRPYYYCVMEDGSDRGLRHLLRAGGADDAALVRAGVVRFERVA